MVSGSSNRAQRSELAKYTSTIGGLLALCVALGHPPSAGAAMDENTGDIPRLPLATGKNASSRAIAAQSPQPDTQYTRRIGPGNSKLSDDYSPLEKSGARPAQSRKQPVLVAVQLNSTSDPLSNNSVRRNQRSIASGQERAQASGSKDSISDASGSVTGICAMLFLGIGFSGYQIRRKSRAEVVRFLPR